MSFWRKDPPAGSRRPKPGKVDFSRVLEDDESPRPEAAKPDASPAEIARNAARHAAQKARNKPKLAAPEGKPGAAPAAEAKADAPPADAPLIGKGAKAGRPRPAERKRIVRLGALKPKAAKAKKPFSLSIGSGSVVSVLALMLLLLAWGGGMTVLMLFGDRMSAKLIAQSSEMQDAYEQRLQAYRDEIKRVVEEAEQTKVGKDDVTTRVRELIIRQRNIEARQAILNKLADQIGADPGASAGAGAGGGAAPAGPAAPPPPPRPTLPARPATPAPTRGDLDAPSPAIRLASSDPAGARQYAQQLLDLQPLETGPTQQEIENDAQVDRLLRAAGVVETQQTAALNGFARLSDVRIMQMRGALTTLGLAPEELAPDTGRSLVNLPGLVIPLNEQNTPFGQRINQIRGNISLLYRLGPAIKTMPMTRPTNDTRLASPFGFRIHPISKVQKLHAGLDMAAPMGVPVIAAGGGVVLSAGWGGGYGNLVQIDHGQGVISRYAHMSAIDVAQGQPIAAGAPVGKVGSTGQSTGPHLHFETRIRGTPSNPACFLIAGEKLRNASGAGMSCEKPPFSHRPDKEDEDEDDDSS